MGYALTTTCLPFTFSYEICREGDARHTFSPGLAQFQFRFFCLRSAPATHLDFHATQNHVLAPVTDALEYRTQARLNGRMMVGAGKSPLTTFGLVTNSTSLPQFLHNEAPANIPQRTSSHTSPARNCTNIRSLGSRIT